MDNIIKIDDTTAEITQAPIQPPNRVIDVNKLVEQNKFFQSRIDSNNATLAKLAAIGVVPDAVI